MLHSLQEKIKKAWLWARLRNLPSIIGVSFSGILMLFGIWQLDLICVGPVWHTWGFVTWFINSNLPVYASEYFECWLWKTTVGEAYNTLLFLIFISWWILLISLWFWKHHE